MCLQSLRDLLNSKSTTWHMMKIQVADVNHYIIQRRKTFLDYSTALLFCVVLSYAQIIQMYELPRQRSWFSIVIHIYDLQIWYMYFAFKGYGLMQDRKDSERHFTREVQHLPVSGCIYLFLFIFPWNTEHS